jgi:hypothetical protein
MFSACCRSSRCRCVACAPVTKPINTPMHKLVFQFALIPVELLPPIGLTESYRSRAGAAVCFLPAHSPDLDPIEQVFTKLESTLHKMAHRNCASIRRLERMTASHPIAEVRFRIIGDGTPFLPATRFRNRYLEKARPEPQIASAAQHSCEETRGPGRRKPKPRPGPVRGVGL